MLNFLWNAYKYAEDFFTTPKIPATPRVGQPFSVTLELSEWSDEDRQNMESCLFAISKEVFPNLKREEQDVHKYDREGKAQFWFTMNSEGDVSLEGYNLTPRTVYYDPLKKHVNFFAKIGPTALSSAFSNRGEGRKSSTKMSLQLFLLRILSHAKTSLQAVKKCDFKTAIVHFFSMFYSNSEIRILCNPGNAGVKRQIMNMPVSFYISISHIEKQIATLTQLLENIHGQERKTRTIEHVESAIMLLNASTFDDENLCATFLQNLIDDYRTQKITHAELTSQLSHAIKKRYTLKTNTEEENRQLDMAYDGLYGKQTKVDHTDIGIEFDSNWHPEHGFTQKTLPTVFNWDAKAALTAALAAKKARKKTNAFQARDEGAVTPSPSRSPASPSATLSAAASTLDEPSAPLPTKQLPADVLGVQKHYDANHKISYAQWLKQSRFGRCFGSLWSAWRAAPSLYLKEEKAPTSTLNLSNLH